MNEGKRKQTRICKGYVDKDITFKNIFIIEVFLKSLIMYNSVVGQRKLDDGNIQVSRFVFICAYP